MAIADDAFTNRLDVLDLSLFDGVPTQSNDGDRRSWLAVQRSVRRPSGYIYLEIGSHLGGSIQQHLLDPWCRKIVAIDKRPAYQLDDRGEVFHYEENSNARMLDNLRRIAPDQLDKLRCYDSDAKDVDPRAIPEPPDFCFIDGEHTHHAVLSDFNFCLSVCAPNAAVCFHDDYITFEALSHILSLLRGRGIPFKARKLGGVTFAIFLRDCAAANDPFIVGCSEDGYSWIRGRRIRALVPRWMQPVARWVARQFRRRRGQTGQS
jgi:hypothetical protein